MAKADLHLHSKYSEHPSEWFLQRIGAGESYTEPEFIYRTAKDRGMDFVTITDHNRIQGSVLLKELYPQDVFTGVEATTYFPEDGCKIHLLIYGLTEAEFEEVQKLRRDIYELRDFVRQSRLPHSVAHATFFVNNKLRLEHIEKLILLFDVFEGINGGRNRINNETWMNLLERLTPDTISDLYATYRIEPFSYEPWVKAFTGGSDDHAGVFIARTHTVARARSVDEFLDRIRSKRIFAEGRHNDFQALALSFYKVAYEFSKTKSSSFSRSLFSQISEMLFEKKSTPVIRGWIQNRKIRSIKRRNEGKVPGLFAELVESLHNGNGKPLEERFDAVYDKLAAMADEYFKTLLQSAEQDVLNADFVSLIRNLASAIPGLFLSAPFYTALRHMYQGRGLLNALEAKYGRHRLKRGKTILWFTDTINDLNGVAVTLKNLARSADERGLDLKVVTSFDPSEKTRDLPPNVVNLPAIFEFPLPYYESYRMRIPSMLRSLKIIHHLEPDEIFISTPGPIGLFGLLMAAIFQARKVGVYHTDFTLHTMSLVQDEDVVRLMDNFSRWFYAQMDEIRVPTQEYMKILEGRGFDLANMKLFRRGMDTSRFAPRTSAREDLERKYGVAKGPVLIYSGRVSRDKNIDFLLDVYKEVLKTRPDVGLFVAGDGPDMESLREKARTFERIVLPGKLDQKILPAAYAGSDLFLFPSTADTFGVVVLEAQLCGLPALVSDQGGPKELVRDGETGFVLPVDDVSAWSRKILDLLDMLERNPEEFARIREASRRSALQKSDWDAVLRELFEDGQPLSWPGRASEAALFTPASEELSR